MMIPPTEDEIQDQIDAAEQSRIDHGSRWPCMSFEDGVSAALRWALGETDERPMDEWMDE